MVINTHYYLILDLNLLAKMENCVPYLYSPVQGWEIDQHNLLMDRIMGFGAYDASMLLSVEEITEEQATAVMRKKT